MKLRWPALFFALLVLCGCCAPIDSAGGSDAIEQTKPTESVGFSVFPEGLSLDTQGAVQAFPLDTESAHGIRFAGSDILVFSGYRNTVLTLLSGETLEILEEIILPCPVFPEEPAVTADGQGVTYVDKSTRELVFLDERLAETRRTALPEDCGIPALSADRRQLFYCTAQGLRVLDLESKLDRPINRMNYPVQELVALHREDQILQCCVIHDDGSLFTLFFSAETGGLLYETPGDMFLRTGNGLYVTTRMDGEYREILSGSDHFGPSVLISEQEPLGIEPVLEQSSLLLWSRCDDGSLSLDFYHLESGGHTASVTLPDVSGLSSVQPDPAGNILWFLCCDPDTGGDWLCRWDMEQSPVPDPGNRLQPRWNPENPDIEGLADCRETAREISEKYEVNILLWTDATAVQPWDYTFIPEYQVPLIRRRLAQLDEILSLYPPGFLREVAVTAGSGTLNICLVRQIRGNPDTGGLESAMGLQFWDSDANAYLAVTPGDDMARHLHHELFHIIDSRVLSSCDAYDSWSSLNPPDFQYDPQAVIHGDQEKLALTAGETRCFIDLYAMSSPKEDRARIMEYAMLPHGEEIFSAPLMQTKLRQLCLGIRKALDSAQTHQPHPWEQYLDTPLP